MEAVELKELRMRIESALDSIRPFLHKDKGDVRLVDISKKKVVRLELLGTCATCPKSHMTLRYGILDKIATQVPEVTKVITIN